MQNFKLAVAQISSQKGNIEENIQSHIQAIEHAGRNNVSLIVFPELSLSGYELELCESLAITVDDFRLNKLSLAAIENNIWIIVGAPLKNKQNIELAAIVISPAGKISTYSKMKLHPGEDKYFKAGVNYKILNIQNQKVAIAICADTTDPEHANNYAKMGASVYVAGVLVTAGGYAADTKLLSSYAKEHNMLVAMANHNKPTGGWSPIGKSAIWSNKGLLSVATKNSNSLVISECVNGSWAASIVEM